MQTIFNRSKPSGSFVLIKALTLQVHPEARMTYFFISFFYF
ncbi:MAG TPA: hypothetical protein PKD56_01470 [Chitinophagales bacterium]|nr:hypothetical protein [Chitinophagales bacterium]